MKKLLLYALWVGWLVMLELKWPLHKNIILGGIEEIQKKGQMMEYGRWILMFVPLLADISIYWERMEQQKTVILHRYGSYRKFLGKGLWYLLFSCMIYASLLYSAAGVVWKTELRSLFLIFTLFLFHSFFVCGIYMILKGFCNRGIIPVFSVMLFEGLGFFIHTAADKVVYCPWRWGMWSSLANDNGIGVKVAGVLFAEFLVFLLPWLIFRVKGMGWITYSFGDKGERND